MPRFGLEIAKIRVMKLLLWVFIFLQIGFVPKLRAEFLCQEAYSQQDEVDDQDEVSDEAEDVQSKRQFAEQLGLHYLQGRGRGYTRKNVGQGVVFLDESGQPIPISDRETLDRIAKLNLDRFDDVWISPDPLSHVQAIGYKEGKPPRYLFHKLWSQVNEYKFDRVLRFGRKLPKLHATIEKDLVEPGLGLQKRLAAVVRSTEVFGIRIGSPRYVLQNGSYGLTTMLGKFVDVDATSGSIRFKFIGKEGVAHDITETDKDLAALLIQLPHKNFHGSDNVFGVSAAQVNSYIRANAGAFTVRDFRTWIATTTAARLLHERGPAKDKADLKKAQEEAGAAAAARLHNEGATSLQYYINPAIFDKYQDGSLDKAFKPANGDDPSCTPEENAVLRLFSTSP